MSRHEDEGHDRPPHEDIPLLGGLVTQASPAEGGRPHRRRRRRSPRRRVLTGLVLLVCLGLVAGAAYAGWTFVRPIVADVTAETDYEGTGQGEVTVQVAEGDTGAAIGQTLAAADVVMTAEAFTAAAGAEPAAAGIQPGTYQLRRQMSGASAVDLLLDPASRVSLRVQLVEGLRAATALEQIATDTGLALEDLQAAATDPAVPLPPEARGNLEGYLFPATYDFEPDVTAVEVVSAMVTRTDEALEQSGVPPAAWHRTLTVASLVEAEAFREEDRPRVARVIENRVAAGMPLQFDTTVDYATGKRGVTTTDEDRATQSPYNTYVTPGLPPGPIDSPGDSAIAAAAAPAEGPWMYFVAVNPDTGETRFAVTFEEHSANVREFQQWLRDN